jgi:hypothetical protein
MTGNKTQLKPRSVAVSSTAAHGGMSASQVKQGHRKLGTIPVYTPPTTEPNNKG